VAIDSATGISVSLNDGDGTFRGPFHFAVTVNTDGRSGMFGDFDEDGDADIVGKTPEDDAVIYLENRYVE
jgi:hypothetical protein